MLNNGQERKKISQREKTKEQKNEEKQETTLKQRTKSKDDKNTEKRIVKNRKMNK